MKRENWYASTDETAAFNKGAVMGEVEKVETWSEIQHSPAKIVACGERWKGVARIIGCELYGFDDGRSASFTTPDGNVIEVGSKFRAAIEARQPLAARVAELEAGLQAINRLTSAGNRTWNEMLRDMNLACDTARALLGEKP